MGGMEERGLQSDASPANGAWCVLSLHALRLPSWWRITLTFRVEARTAVLEQTLLREAEVRANEHSVADGATSADGMRRRVNRL